MATKTKKSAKGSAKAKKANKTVKSKAKGTRPAKDNARLVSKASEGQFTTDQVRQLRALRKTDWNSGRTMNLSDMKEAVGIGREGKYSSKWLNGLWDLQKQEYIFIGEAEEGTDSRTNRIVITHKGKQALEKAEKGAKSL